MRRFLIMSALLFVGLIGLCGAGLAVFAYAWTRADPFPTFMADYQLRKSHSYPEAVRAFSEFVVRAFPIGSDAKDAIAQINKGGFQVTTSGSDSVELLWKRRAGPCNELYSIVVNPSANGRIAKIAGQLQPVCL